MSRTEIYIYVINKDKLENKIHDILSFPSHSTVKEKSFSFRALSLVLFLSFFFYFVLFFKKLVYYLRKRNSFEKVEMWNWPSCVGCLMKQILL